MNLIKRVAAAIAVASLAACGANAHGSSVEPTRTAQHVGRLPASVAHGAEIERAQTFIISEGSNHVFFPPGATWKRTASGIEVTYNGTTRTFSSSAKLEMGAYHKYAKAQ